MSFNWEVSIGNLISIAVFISSIVMFILTLVKQSKTKNYAESANSYFESAKKYYDLMIELTPNMINGAVTKGRKNLPQKANCDASVIKLGKGKWILKVFNKGDENATNISFKFLNDGPDIIGPMGNTFPIKLLEPQNKVEYHLIVHMGLNSASWDYEITWTNEDSTTDSKKGVLTLPLS